MELTQGMEQLIHTMQSPHFTIDSIDCYHDETECKQQLLTGLPLHNLVTLVLGSNTFQSLPQCLPEVVHIMIRLRMLGLYRATADSLSTTLQALLISPIATLGLLNLAGSEFTMPVMKDCCRVLLRHNKSLAGVGLGGCYITDEQAFCLAETLPSINKLSNLWLTGNDIHDAGALAIAKALHRLPELNSVDLKVNAIGDKGRESLEEYKKTKKHVELNY